MGRVYECGTCGWRGSIDEMVVVQCPRCSDAYLTWVDGSDDPHQVFHDRRTRDREAAMDDKKQKRGKRPGVFERVGKLLHFRRNQ